ncbi:MAG TPA: GTPase ObgE [Candidatus Aphodocola excrementigallinarum]|uniref:GTPase Obg n=1 Tax=Candidatus Aphodocola excrementigallinarum TaxID=2840670 RepID=A0A9D1IN96_9FIRM|nr:GTPase ObgE [Candidatus Aphodocola excrementigallinarum]
MFVDEVIIKVKAGNGGDGCTAFRREKFIPDGGPFGGNGGHGANIIFKTDLGLKTLLDLRYNKLIKAPKGANGSGKNKNGKGAEDVVIKVPLGTTVTDMDTGLIIADLTKKDDSVIVAHGGRGGRGNTAFATPSNPAPNFSEKGEPGEEKTLKVELRLLADVGFVGMPSVGKSTILSKISRSKPKIAAYHFTTLNPNLGVVRTIDDRTFVAADLPGLIKGASLGEGLGDKFLKHIERTRVIAHVLDMSGLEGRSPLDDYETINKELYDFDPKLMKKPQVIIANKMDLEGAKENLKKFKEKYKKEVYEVSAIKNIGLDEVLVKIADELDNIKEEPLFDEDSFESHVLYKFKKEQPFTITRDNDIYVVKGKEVEKLFKMTKFTDEGAIRFARKLRGMGIDDELVKMGCKPGDRVQIMDMIFEFKE